MKRFALSKSPKVIIWMIFGGNDFRDVKEYDALRRDFDKPEPPVPTVKKLFLNNLLISVSLWLSKKYKQDPTNRGLEYSGLYSKHDGTIERVYFSQTNDLQDEYAWKVATDTLLDADQLSRQSGAKLIVVYIPRKFRIYKKYLEVQPNTIISGWKLNNFPDDMKKWCTENNIDYIDTTPALEKSVAEGIHPYFFDDVHWNPLGHKIAADLVLAHMKEKNIYPFTTNDNK